MDDAFFSPEPIIWVQEFFGRGHELVFMTFSALGETWGALLVIGLAFWIWGRDAAYAALAAVAMSVLLKEGMNILVKVPRPTADAIIQYQHLETPSFPSGHVVTAVAAWTFLSLRQHLSWIWPTLAAILVSLGRLYLGSHYLVDVVVGILLGLFIGWMVNRWWAPVREQLEKLSFKLYALVAALAAVLMAINLWRNAGIPHRWEVTGTALGLIGGFVWQARVRVDTGRWQVAALGLAGLLAVAVGSQWITSLPLRLAFGAAGALWVAMTPAMVRSASQ